MGPVRVTVKSDIKESTYRGKPNYVILTIDGHDRYYDMENAECENFWTGHMGQTFTVEAEGSRETAGFLALDDQPEESGPVTGDRGQRQTQQPSATPPVARPTSSRELVDQPRNRPPANPATDPSKALGSVKVALAKQMSLVKLCLSATVKLADDWKAKYGSDMTGDLFQSINAMFYIELNRKHPMDGMPVNLDFKTLLPAVAEPKPKAKPAQAAPPPPPDPVAQEPAEPVEDDVPF